MQNSCSQDLFLNLLCSSTSKKIKVEDIEGLSFDSQIAIVTHYLQTKNTEFDKSFLTAKKILQIWAENDSLKGVFCSANATTIQKKLVSCISRVPFTHNANPKFTFIDLFAGIGGFRLALQSFGGKCVFSSEWDENAKKTYYANFGEVPFGDITTEQTKSYIPDNFDVLCAGFPCQAFSIAGRRMGFEDTRGTLFFDVAEIIRRKRPAVVLLENVKNLASHDNGKTFKVICNTLNDLNYTVFAKVLNADEYANIPQNRERIFFVCFDNNKIHNSTLFSFPGRVMLKKNLSDCIEQTKVAKRYYYTADSMNHYAELKESITSKDHIYQWRRKYVRQNKSGVCPTLTANMGSGGHNVPLILVGDGIRKLTPRECLNFQGYPQNFVLLDSLADSAKYKQAGNSVVVPLIERICCQMLQILLPNL